MDFLSSFGINLPPIVFAHAVFCSAVGLRAVLSRPAHRTRPKNSTAAPDGALTGILLLAIGLCYLTTSYVPLEENQVLYASVPVRLGLALLAGLRLLLIPGLSNQGRGDMWTVLLYDGIGAAMCGWELGVWNGRVPGGRTAIILTLMNAPS